MGANNESMSSHNPKEPVHDPEMDELLAELSAERLAAKDQAGDDTEAIPGFPDPEAYAELGNPDPPSKDYILAARLQGIGEPPDRLTEARRNLAGTFGDRPPMDHDNEPGPDARTEQAGSYDPPSPEFVAAAQRLRDAQEASLRQPARPEHLSPVAKAITEESRDKDQQRRGLTPHQIQLENERREADRHAAPPRKPPRP